jgi:hypothetical protein
MKFNIEKLLFFDVETVSKYQSLYDMIDIELDMWMRYYESSRKKVTDETKLDGLKEGSKEYYNEVYRQTAAFFPEFGKVACVSMAFVNKGKTKFDSYYGKDELEILKNVRNIFDKVDKLDFSLCGHSIKVFDIPFLGKRYFINGLRPPTIFPNHDTKPWELKVLDTKDIWQFGNNWSLGSLDLICSALNIESPKNGDVKGDNVTSSYWLDKHEEIKEYCERDTKSLVDIITKLNNLQ